MINLDNNKIEENYYDVLGLKPDASQEDVEKAYSKLKKKYADQQTASYSISSQTAVERINSLLEEAYCVLSSYKKRLEYHKSKNLKETFNEYDEHYSLEKENLKKSLFEKRSQEIEFTYLIDQKFENEIDCLSDFSGETLKEIRLYKGVSLESMAKSSNIMKTYLVAIEEENFAKLPANVYLRGFVFQYAKILKLNPDLVIDSYMQRVKLHRKQFN